MSPHTQLNPDALNWLLEENEPGVRYLGPRDIIGLPADDPVLTQARTQAHREGPIATVLDAMEPEGFWVEPGPGYNPKYRSTVWALIVLGQLGASIAEDDRTATTCQYLLHHALTEHGQFGTAGTSEWMAHSVAGEGIAPIEDTSMPTRYYAGPVSRRVTGH